MLLLMIPLILKDNGSFTMRAANDRPYGCFITALWSMR